MVLLLTTLFQGFVMANEVEKKEAAALTEISNENKDTEKVLSKLEELITLSRYEIEMFFYIYDKFGYKAVYETYCIFYDVTLEDWEIDLYIEGCLIVGVAGGLYALEKITGKI